MKKVLLVVLILIIVASVVFFAKTIFEVKEVKEVARIEESTSTISEIENATSGATSTEISASTSTEASTTTSTISENATATIISSSSLTNGNGEKQPQACVREIETKIFRNTTMSGILEKDDVIKIFVGYYDCVKIQRGDIIAYGKPDSNDPIIKVVKGIPGDIIALDSTSTEASVFINEKIAATSNNIPFKFKGGVIDVFLIYLNNFKGVIPDNTYLVMGNVEEKPQDGLYFSFVTKDEIIGKATR